MASVPPSIRHIMAEPDFAGFEELLMRAGISPRHVRRSVAELREHFADIEDAMRRQGASRADAGRMANAELGDLDIIAAGIASHPELKCWSRRWPRMARVVYPLACICLVPAIPVLTGARHASLIARWGTCLVLSAGFTAALMLVLQLAIRAG